MSACHDLFIVAERLRTCLSVAGGPAYEPQIATQTQGSSEPHMLDVDIDKDINK